MFRFLEDLHQAVYERCQPQEPFQEGCHHDCSHDGHIDDLRCQSVTYFPLPPSLRTYILIRPFGSNGRDLVIVRHCALLKKVSKVGAVRVDRSSAGKGTMGFRKTCKRGKGVEAMPCNATRQSQLCPHLIVSQSSIIIAHA